MLNHDTRINYKDVADASPQNEPRQLPPHLHEARGAEKQQELPRHADAWRNPAVRPVPCYHPLHGYHSKHENATGKRSWVRHLSQAKSAERLSIPCGRCIGCRLEKSRQWAMRCLHESELHEENSFITLTYDSESLPYGGTLIKKDFQDFAKRLRKKYPAPRKIKYFHCGEYGEKCGVCGKNKRDCECERFDPVPGRPHYHALLFGLDFADKTPFTKSKDGSTIFTSEILQRLWPSGFCTTGAVTFESAAYVARYVMKKITGKAADDHYEVVEPTTGEVLHLLPEYTTMSLKPAIAKEWYAQFKGDAFPSDFLVVRGRKMKPPKFYDRLLELEDPTARAAIKERRMKESLLREGDSTTARLLVREEVKLAQIQTLKRGLE